MFKNLAIAGIANLLILTICCAQEEQGRVLQILAIAKEVNATDEQVAEAIAKKQTPKEFISSMLGRIRLIAPEKAPKGAPVQIAVEGLPDKATELWRRHPTYDSDIWLELYSRDGKPINIFWSSDQGPRTFELIVAENGPEVPTLDIASHQLQYGEGNIPDPGPGPLPFPEPPSPTPDLMRAVNPLAEFANKIEAQDLLNLSEFYSDFSDIVRRDGTASIIKDTLIFRNTYTRAGQLMFQQTGIDNKYAGLSEIVDGILTDILGLDIGPLNHTKTSNILSAIAWAFYQPLKKER